MRGFPLPHLIAGRLFVITVRVFSTWGRHCLLKKIFPVSSSRSIVSFKSAAALVLKVNPCISLYIHVQTPNPGSKSIP